MPKVSDMKSGTYLRKEDLESPRILTIKPGSFFKKNMAKEDEEPDYKWTMGFLEEEKILVLNVDKIDTMSEIFGSENTDDWEGKKIVVYIDPNVKFGGKKVGGLKIRAPKQQPKTQHQRPLEDVNAEIGSLDDDIPWEK